MATEARVNTEKSFIQIWQIRSFVLMVFVLFLCIFTVFPHFATFSIKKKQSCFREILCFSVFFPNSTHFFRFSYHRNLGTYTNANGMLLLFCKIFNCTEIKYGFGFKGIPFVWCRAYHCFNKYILIHYEFIRWQINVSMQMKDKSFYLLLSWFQDQLIEEFVGISKQWFKYCHAPNLKGLKQKSTKSKIIAKMKSKVERN